MTDLIKVNGIYWQCKTYFTTSKPLYRNVKVIAIDAKQKTVDFYYIGNIHRILTCSTEVFLSNFGETQKEAFKKEFASEKKNELFNLNNK